GDGELAQRHAALEPPGADAPADGEAVGGVVGVHVVVCHGDSVPCRKFLAPEIWPKFSRRTPSAGGSAPPECEDPTKFAGSVRSLRSGAEQQRSPPWSSSPTDPVTRASPPTSSPPRGISTRDGAACAVTTPRRTSSP